MIYAITEPIISGDAALIISPIKPAMLPQYVIARKSPKAQTATFMQVFQSSFKISFLHGFLCGGQHQFDAVELIDLRSTRVVVYRDDVCLGICFLEHFNHALTYHMVRKAGKRLNAYNVRNTGTE